MKKLGWFQKDRRGRNAPAVIDRRPQQSGAPRVFSYYSSQRNRSNPASYNRGEAPRTDQREKPPGGFKARQLPAIGAVVVIVLSCLYSLTLSGEVKVRVTLLGNDQQSTVYRPAKAYQEAVMAAIRHDAGNKTKLTLNRESIEALVAKQLPEVSDVRIATPLVSRDLVVTVETAPPGIVLQQNGETWLLDSRGTAITKVSDAVLIDKDTTATVLDESSSIPEAGKGALPAAEVVFIKRLATQLNAENKEVVSLKLPAGIANELHVTVKDQPYFVKFALNGDMLTQTGTFLATAEQLKEQGIIPEQYIDVRVEGRAFYK